MVRTSKRKSIAYQSALNLPAGAPGPGSRPARAPVLAKDGTVPDDEGKALLPPPRRLPPPPTPPPVPPRRSSKRQTKIKLELQPLKAEPEPDTEVTAAPARKGKGKGKGKARQTPLKLEKNDDALVFPSGNCFAVVINTGPARRRELKSYVPMVEVDDGAAPKPKRVRVRREEKGKGKARTPIELDSDDGDEGEVLVTSTRKRKGKGKERSATVEMDPEEEEDLKEDLAFVAPKRQVLSSRTRNGGGAPKLTAFQKKLKELKAKRAGVPVTADSDSSDSPRAALYDTDPSDASDEESTAARYPHADDALDGESWIIDDEEDASMLGHPDNQIPLQYTSLSHQDMETNFNTYCLWMMQVLLNPSFPPEDPISQISINALTRHVESFRTSILQSSAWDPRFVRAIRARPNFTSKACEERPDCDACRISGRSATFVACFTGPQYDKETLEDLTGSDAEDSEDSMGQEIPPESTGFYLGRFCHARAKQTHDFTHWKKSLHTAINDMLKEYLSDRWKNKAAKMSVEERTRWVNGINEDFAGHIKTMYFDFKRSLKAAEKSMNVQQRNQRVK